MSKRQASVEQFIQFHKHFVILFYFGKKFLKLFKTPCNESEIYSELENFEPVQVNFNGEVQFKAGTNFKANSYLCLNGSK